MTTTRERVARALAAEADSLYEFENIAFIREVFFRRADAAIRAMSEDGWFTVLYVEPDRSVQPASVTASFDYPPGTKYRVQARLKEAGHE